jgi:hypothetical protein
MQLPTPPETPESVSPQDMAILVKRMRSVLTRMDADERKPKPPGAAQLQAWRAVRDEGKARGARRTRAFASVENRMQVVNAQFGLRLEEAFKPRLAAAGAVVVPDIERTLHDLAINEASRMEETVAFRLTAIERALQSSLQQLEHVRDATLRSYSQTGDFGERLDGIWNEQDSSGVGGWRLWLRKAWAEVTERPGREDARLAGEERTLSPGMLCPKCGEMEGRRRPRYTMLEIVMRGFYVAPYRCSRCRHHYYKFSRH